MRPFASIPPTVWQAEAKKLRGDTEAIAVLFHLLTSQHSSMIGVYPLAIGYMAHDLGIPFEGASKGLQRVCDSGLATYDHERELVWVYDMALAQVASRLAPKDNRVTAIAKQLELLPICPITLGFYEKYREVYHLSDNPITSEFERAFQGASKGLRSKNKNKEQDKDLEEGKEEPCSGGKDNSQQQAETMFTPFPKPNSPAEGRTFLLSKGVPPDLLDICLPPLMDGNLSQYDLEGILADARSAA